MKSRIFYCIHRTAYCYAMRLTQFSDIGLRVLLYLAGARQPRALVTVAEIANQFDIPANHLAKVVGRMAQAGWVETSRGRNGGITLRPDARTILIGNVLRTLEGEAELVDCSGQNCALRADCLLRDALASGLQAFYDAMNRYTLADIVGGTTGERIVVLHRRYLQAMDLGSP